MFSKSSVAMGIKMVDMIDRYTPHPTLDTHPTTPPTLACTG